MNNSLSAVYSQHTKREYGSPFQIKQGAMDHLSSEVEQPKPKPQRQKQKELISLRRSQVLDLSSQGRTEREIATILRVGAATIGRDLAYLNKQARESLQVHIQERLPEQYQKCCNGLTQVLKMAWNIVLLETGTGTGTGTANNHNIRLQALSLINDCYKYQMDLSTNGIIVTDAIKYVQDKMDHLNATEKKVLQDIHIQKADSLEEEESNSAEGKTTNGVF